MVSAGRGSLQGPARGESRPAGLAIAAAVARPPGTVMDEPNEPSSTGISGLDEILCGGLPRGRMYLAQGHPGVGKTTLALQFLLAGVARGETTLYIALSESKAEITDIATSHGWDVSAIHIHELTAAEQSAQVDQDNTLFDPAEVDLHETTRSLLAEVERLKPARVVFDSLSELRMLAQNPLRYRRQVLALKDYFADRNCTVLLLDDGITDRSDLQLQTLAHGVIVLEHLVPEYGGDRRRLRVVKLRGLQYRGGYHDFMIRRGGIDVFPRLVAADHASSGVRDTMSTGDAELDHLVGGGIDRGASTLLIGPAGSGKSAIACTIAFAAAKRGEFPTVFAFDESRAVFFARARSLGLGIEQQVESGAAFVRQIDPGELSPGQFTSLVCDQVERCRSRVVVIDSLNGYLTAMPEERFLVIQMHELLTYLSQKGVATILVMAQHGLVGTMASPVDVTYLADTVVLTRYFESQGAVLKAVSVLKRRSGRHENTIRQLTLSDKGISIGEPLREFHGVMTGVPQFVGASAALRSDDKSR
jgi:circadian clock protein KaiC